MARIISIPPAPAAAGGGGLSGNLVAGLVGDRVVDPFAVADNNGICGQLLRDLIGPAFDPHRTLNTMNAVAASATAMNAVAASATAMDAVWASSTAWNIVRDSNMAVGKFVAGRAGQNATSFADMNAVAASLTARQAVRQSSTAINAINASQLALDAMYTAATKFTYAGGSWSANPATLVGSGNYLIVRIRQLNNVLGGSIGHATGQYVRRGDGTGWTMTDGASSLNIVNRSHPATIDNALRTVNNLSIQYHFFNSFEIAYLTA